MGSWSSLLNIADYHQEFCGSIDEDFEGIGENYIYSDEGYQILF